MQKKTSFLLGLISGVGLGITIYKYFTDTNEQVVDPLKEPEDLDDTYDKDIADDFDKQHLCANKIKFEKDTTTVFKEQDYTELPFDDSDFDNSLFELVCGVSRSNAISTILEHNSNYKEIDLVGLTNSQLTEIYSSFVVEPD